MGGKRRSTGHSTVPDGFGGLCTLFLFEKVPVPITFGGYQWRIMKRVILLGLSPFLIIAFDNVLIIAKERLCQQDFGGAEGDMLLTCNTIVQELYALR